MNAVVAATLDETTDITTLNDVDRTTLRNHLARELLVLEKSIAPTTTRMETISNILRSFGEFTTEVGGLGKVQVTKASIAAKKGEEPQINLDTWAKLTETRRKGLIRDGIVKIVEIFSQNRKASVKTTLNV